MRRAWMGIAVMALVAACGGDDDRATTTAPPSTTTTTSEVTTTQPPETTDTADPAEPPDLGAPVLSRIPPIVVPANAFQSVGMSTDDSVQYTFPAGTSEADLIAWYEVHMPPGQDFEGLRWLEALPGEDEGPGAYWYWCSGPGQAVNIVFFEYSPGDGGSVGLNRGPLPDGSCG